MFKTLELVSVRARSHLGNQFVSFFGAVTSIRSGRTRQAVRETLALCTKYEAQLFPFMESVIVHRTYCLILCNFECCSGIQLLFARSPEAFQSDLYSSRGVQ